VKQKRGKMVNPNCVIGKRNRTHKKDPYWKIHIMRRVAPGQENLEKQLGLLGEYTSDFVNYKKMGQLGVTLVMLEPILHKIMGVNRGEKIRKNDLDKFVDELNDLFEEEDCTLPLDDEFNPYGIYGRGKRYLGIQLSRRSEDSPLYGDRTRIMDYIVDNYGMNKRFIRNNTIRLKPHITLGTIDMGNLDSDERRDINRDPSRFILRRMQEDKYYREDVLRVNCPEIPVIPEQITLNGLRAVVERR
jgi:hypothetical protein